MPVFSRVVKRKALALGHTVTTPFLKIRRCCTRNTLCHNFLTLLLLLIFCSKTWILLLFLYLFVSKNTSSPCFLYQTEFEPVSFFVEPSKQRPLSRLANTPDIRCECEIHPRTLIKTSMFITFSRNRNYTARLVIQVLVLTAWAALSNHQNKSDASAATKQPA